MEESSKDGREHNEKEQQEKERMDKAAQLFADVQDRAWKRIDEREKEREKERGSQQEDNGRE
ncbi:hypothetical protein HBHAL_6007 (plasmid) [Halobacillus halophilus DSM 2266]|uniref:Uncharacterized protein n=1 Tax=Halobacillus halophilus (strain ATCC 35676 / DSM 2266 / JCM 20832 / KCTC 3685 / LMG 17431 / NBRC 102448 / NCIMB 2269) TaxID=866895 RepID=I0JTP4_HALH3|nr:hypothetical protein [Halobacillus halophilus]CCG47517.1 hypothetical protein HBHAL_6007 [Halobacillus halophilus DSM 2266]